jgi:hypothetical protein
MNNWSTEWPIDINPKKTEVLYFLLTKMTA